MMATKERVEGHYEVEAVPYGKVYRWVPVEGQDGRPLVEDPVYYPEQRAYEQWGREEVAHPYLRHYEWLELQSLLGG